MTQEEAIRRENRQLRAKEVKKMGRQKSFICIDLKSFYASVECVERGLDPFKTNLVVADPTRSQSTICLAITPAMKKLGVKNRCRIHEIPAGIEYITAMPRMQLYIDYSARIYSIYLRYISKEDIHVYSIDECFMDVTNYLSLYHMTEKEMAVELMDAVMKETGITATAGIGTNLYLAKVAMDIVAKHVEIIVRSVISGGLVPEQRESLPVMESIPWEILLIRLLHLRIGSIRCLESMQNC